MNAQEGQAFLKGENNKLIIERNNLKNPVYVGIQRRCRIGKGNEFLLYLLNIVWKC